MLEIRSVSKSFEKKLFEKFSLTVKEDEIVAITGPSGCGKTTLLRIICGLENMDGGDIILNGVNLNHIEPENRNIGLIFQKPVLFPHLSVSGNLKLGDRNADITISLKEVNLEGLGGRDVDSLSGGEGQRVAIARALLAKPKALLLDEPFTAIDKELSVQLVRDIRSLLKSRGCPAILVTHDIDIAEKFADRIIPLNR